MTDLAGAAGENAENFATLFPNIRALVAALPLATQASNDFRMATEQIAGAFGSVNQALGTVHEGFLAKLEILGNATERILIPLGALSGEGLKPILDLLINLAIVTGNYTQQLDDQESAASKVLDVFKRLLPHYQQSIDALKAMRAFGFGRPEGVVMPPGRGQFLGTLGGTGGAGAGGAGGAAGGPPTEIPASWQQQQDFGAGLAAPPGAPTPMPAVENMFQEEQIQATTLRLEGLGKAMRDVMNTTEEAQGVWTSFLTNAKKGVTGLAMSFSRQLAGAITDSILHGKNFGKTMIEMLIKLAVQFAVATAAAWALAIALKALKVASMGPIGLIMHEGGMVRAHQGLMTNPQRAHSGLAPDEVPIIAQRGEAVLSRSKGVPAIGGPGGVAMANAGIPPGQAITVNVDTFIGEEDWVEDYFIPILNKIARRDVGMETVFTKH
jgi:hypothetical protein